MIMCRLPLVAACTVGAGGSKVDVLRLHGEAVNLSVDRSVV